MHDRNKSKQRELISRIAVYALMTFSVAALVILSLMYVLGYRFDSTSHRVEQSGLVQFLTQPSGATVEVNGITLPQKTTTKESVLPGDHEFVMWREGYETWRKTLTIKAGTITWLNYTRLIPKERPVEVVDEIATVSDVLTSPNRKYLALIPDESKPNVRFYSVTQSTVPGAKTVVLDTAVYAEASNSGAAHRFVLESWDQNDRRIILKHIYGEKKTVEWLIVDRDTGTTTSMTQQMDVALDKLVFADTSGENFYGLSNSDVRRIDIARGTLSRPIISDVTNFWLHDETETLSYVEQANATGYRAVGVVKRDHKPVTLYRSDSELSSPLTIRAARYFGTDYVVVQDGQKVMLYSGTFPEDENDAMKKRYSTTADHAITDLQFSPTGRFVVVQQGAQFVTYDIERSVLSPLATLAGKGAAAPIRWLDDFMIWSDRSGELVTREFDGANEHVISEVATGFDVALSPNGRYLYSLGKTKTGYQLQRVKLILD